MKVAAIYAIFCVLASALLLWALAPKHSYDFFILLRFVTCGVSALGAYLAIKRSDAGWGVILIALAILFNSLLPVPLKRETWRYVDATAAGLLLLSAGCTLWAARKGPHG